MQPSRNDIYEPLILTDTDDVLLAFTGSESVVAITQYLKRCVSYIKTSCPAARNAGADAPPARPEDIVSILLHHDFNYQSKRQVAGLLPAAKALITAQMDKGQALEIFFDYGGGYHAATRLGAHAELEFGAAATELLLIYQIARLRQRLAPLYPPGLKFHIVLDNIVARDVNDIPLALTEGYAKNLEALIDRLHAGDWIDIWLQSRLGVPGVSARVQAAPPASHMDAAAHRNIERFLGRSCSEDEAKRRAGRYGVAIAAWEGELRPRIAAVGGLRLLQRGSAEYLSFRPFPGGATRAQCGHIGFKSAGARVVPTLITTQVAATANLISVPLDFPSILRAGTESEADAYPARLRRYAPLQ